MLLAELTIGAEFTSPNGEKWVLTEQMAEADRIIFTLNRVKPENEPDSLILESG